MDKQRKKELADSYRRMKVSIGVYQVTNTANGKLFIDSCNNLKNRWLTLRLMLEDGRHPNRAFQTEWTEAGADAFVYEVLEETEIEADLPPREKTQQLKEMKEKWLAEKQPFGARGYNNKLSSE